MIRSRHPSVAKYVSYSAIIRGFACLAVLATLAACTGRREQVVVVDQSREAAQYQARARGNYLPPGPADDPWGPYISEAANKFDVPERWIREVMRVESDGELIQNGLLVTSPVGAMGLMQVMPETYDDIRYRYGLGEDAYEPHDNIQAGAAYMREMYDIYGSPGFLAAYNAGPRRLDDYLDNIRPLPEETRRYVAEIGPYVIHSYPQQRSQAEQYAMNALPIYIPPGLRYGGRMIQYASARPAPGRIGRGGSVKASRMAQSRHGGSHPVEVAEAAPPLSGRHHGRFHLIEPAAAETVPGRRDDGPGRWAVQVGAFASAGQAHAAAGSAKERAALGGAKAKVAGVRQGREMLYRARLTGMSKESAVEACHRLTRSKKNCLVLSPDSQS